MPGETDLERLLADLRPIADPARYVFCSVPGGLADHLALEPCCCIREDEGLTLVIERDRAGRAGLPAEPAFVRITLAVHSSLEAVGLMAAVARRLAAAGIPVNPVAGFYHDHLFVPEARADEALSLLQPPDRSFHEADPSGER